MRLRLNLQICRYVNSSGEKLTYKFLSSHQDAVRFFPRYYSKSVCCSINEHTMQLKTLFFQHHSGTTYASSITSLSTLLSTLTNQLRDIIQHRVSVIEKIQLVQLYKEAVKLFLVHQSLFWPSMVPWLSLGSWIPLSDVKTTGPAPVTTEYSEIIGFLSEEPPEPTWLTVIISGESWNVTSSIWRITVSQFRLINYRKYLILRYITFSSHAVGG